MNIRKVNTENRRDTKQFVDFPYQMYCSTPNWIPPLKSQIRKAMNRSEYPFYRHSTADFFVVESG